MGPRVLWRLRRLGRFTQRLGYEFVGLLVFATRMPEASSSIVLHLPSSAICYNYIQSTQARSLVDGLRDVLQTFLLLKGCNFLIMQSSLLLRW